MYSAILFDLDNTLIDRDQAFARLVRSWFVGQPALVEEIIRLDQHGYGDHQLLFSELAKQRPFGLSRQNLGQLIARHLDPCPNLNNALRQLSQRVTTGIITNGSTENQLAKWQASGLDQVIPRSRVWISEELGVSKPSPKIYRIACRAIQVDPVACLFIGDQPQIDLQGAHQVGMDTLLANVPLTAKDIRRYTLQLSQQLKASS